MYKECYVCGKSEQPMYTCLTEELEYIVCPDCVIDFDPFEEVAGNNG